MSTNRCIQYLPPNICHLTWCDAGPVTVVLTADLLPGTVVISSAEETELSTLGWWSVGTASRSGPHCKIQRVIQSRTPYTWAEKFESFERINSIRETNGNFDSCNSCKRLGTSRLHELHESKFPFVSRIEFIRSKLSNFSAHVGIRGHWRGSKVREVETGRFCYREVIRLHCLFAIACV